MKKKSAEILITPKPVKEIKNTILCKSSCEAVFEV